jgi:hypothetical protein
VSILGCFGRGIHGGGAQYGIVGGRLGAFWVARCIVGAWVGVVKKCGARTAATRVSVSGNLVDLFDIVSQL